MLGAEFDEDEEGEEYSPLLDSKGEQLKRPKKRKKKTDMFQFGDPKDYEHLSQEEKERLTQQMMGVHQVWAKKTSLS